MTATQLAFWIIAPLAVLGGLMMVISRKAVHSALWLALSMICLALLYMMQGAVFLGIVQIVVYTGAVMMLFLFVLMLVGVDASDSLVETLRGQRVAAVAGGVGLRPAPDRRGRAHRGHDSRGRSPRPMLRTEATSRGSRG